MPLRLKSSLFKLLYAIREIAARISQYLDLVSLESLF
jgi:hypothetical protein